MEHTAYNNSIEKLILAAAKGGETEHSKLHHRIVVLMLIWNVVDHSDWQLVMVSSSPAVEDEFCKIRSFMQTLFQHNFCVRIADVTDIHGRINALRAQERDSFPCRYALAFCLNGKMASEMRQSLWWSDGDHTQDMRDLLRLCTRSFKNFICFSI
jgi:hypothetical protein